MEQKNLLLWSYTLEHPKQYPAFPGLKVLVPFIGGSGPVDLFLAYEAGEPKHKQHFYIYPLECSLNRDSKKLLRPLRVGCRGVAWTHTPKPQTS